MESSEFTDLVKEMRRIQKLYFKNRERTVLEKSKELERLVDKHISEQQATTIQTTLKLD
jgi:hypothetical protein